MVFRRRPTAPRAFAFGSWIMAVLGLSAAACGGGDDSTSAGSIVFFECDQEGAREVEGQLRLPTCQFFIVDPGAGTPKALGKPLTNRFLGKPSWAPDGRRIAFSSCELQGSSEEPTSSCEIETMTVPDGKVSRLWKAEVATYVTSVRWSPKGDKLATGWCSENDDRCAILVIDAVSGKARELDIGNPSLRFDVPSWSPSGEVLAFSARLRSEPDSMYSWDIYTIRADGSELTNISAKAGGIGSDWEATWSPDGMRIAFVRLGEDQGESSHWYVLVVDADGSNAKSLTAMDSGKYTHYGDPAWSVDGSMVAFQRETLDRSDVWVVSGDGTDLRRASANLEPEVDYRFVDWSPDGRRLATTGQGSVFVVDASTGAFTRVTEHRKYVYYPTWSPVPSREPLPTVPVVVPTARPTGISGATGAIAFILDGQLRTILPDGTGATQLTNSGASSIGGWSPDGRSIAITRVLPDVALPGGRTMQNWDIVVVRADGSGETNLTDSPGVDQSASWSRDGRRLVFTHQDGYAASLFVVNADGSGVQQIVTGNMEALWSARPLWAPDGTWIAFDGTESGKPGIWVLRPDGTEFRKVADDIAPGGGNFGFLADGRLQYFALASGSTVNRVLVGIDLTTGRREILDTKPVGAAPWAPGRSPDGRYTAYIWSRGDEMQVRVATADSSVVATLATGAYACCASWSPVQ